VLKHLVATLALLVPLVAGPASQAASLSWPVSLQTTSAVTLQSGADSSSLTGTACWSSSSCVAVGEDDASGAEQAIVVPEANGVPGQAAAVTLPANAQSGSGEVASLNGVSCSAAGACVAVGEYVDTSGVTDALVVPIAVGVIGTGVEVTVPGTSGESYLRSVSCAATGACVAVGTYGVDSNAYQEAVVVPISGGVPGAASEVRLPSNADTSTPSVWVNSVSCWSATSCVAAGQYQLASGAFYPLVIPISGGVPGAGIEVVLPADAFPGTTAGQQSALGSVSCQPTGACVSVGYYVNTNGGSRPLVVPSTGGAPAAAGEVSLPANAAAGASDDGLNAVSCAPSGSCAAVGYYVDTYGSGEALLISVSDGVVAAGVQAPLPADALAPSTTDQDASLGAVVCPVSGSCLAVGDFSDASDYQQGLVAPVSGGTAKAGNQAALPTSETVDPDATLDTLACTTPGSCVAGGQYANAAPLTGALGFEYTLQTPLSISTSALPGTRVGSRYDTTLTAADAWGSYTWSLKSGRVPAGLKLNAETGVISGRPKNTRTYRFTVRVTGPGDPAQTTSRAFSIAPQPVLTVSIGHGGLKLSGKDVSIPIRCSKLAACRGSLKLVFAHEVTLKDHKRKRESIVIGQARYSLSKGRSRNVRIKLTAAGLKFLRQAKKKHRLSVVLEVALTGGRSATSHTSVYSAVVKKKS
jgi:hypothetical protein